MSPWPQHKSYFWERLPFFRILLPFVAGILIYESGILNVSFSCAVIIACCCLSLFAILIISRKKLTALMFVSVNVFLLSAAWLSAYTHDVRNHKDWFGRQIHTANAFAVVVSGKPAEKERTWKVPVTVEHALLRDKTSPSTGKAFLYLYKDGSPLPITMGDKLIVPQQWQKIKNAGNPYEFDYAKYAARNNIHYQQFLPVDDVLVYGQVSQLPWWTEIHEWAMAELAQYIGDKPTLGLIQAMLIGDEANMDADLRQTYAETGIIHIVAISGSHITIFFFIISFLLGWIRNRRYHWLKYIIAIPLIWIYVLIAGAPPSAVRAACMFSLLGIGFAFQKQNNSLNQLLATAFILLLAQPYWLFSVGFQLSFLAVLSIVLFYPPIYKLWHPAQTVIRGLWAAAAVSIAAEILVAPLVIYYFHLFPAMFLVANVAAYLFMGFVLVLGMLIIACSNIPLLASVLATLTTWLVGVFNQMVHAFRSFSPESFGTLLLTGFELFCTYYIITVLAIYIFQKKKPALFSALTACALVLGSFIIREYKAIHQQQLVVYNISRTNHVEVINGHTYSVLATDTTYPESKMSYTLKPAHIGFRSFDVAQPGGNQVFTIGNHTVLLLSSAPLYTGKFPVDYVVINYKPTLTDIERIKTVFNPRMAIMGNNLIRRKQSEIALAATNNGLRLHITGSDGAFILSR